MVPSDMHTIHATQQLVPPFYSSFTNTDDIDIDGSGIQFVSAKISIQTTYNCTSKDITTPTLD